VGLEALERIGVLGKEDGFKLIFGKVPRERMGRRRKFVFTLLRNC
jgi:hypothetical protein